MLNKDNTEEKLKSYSKFFDGLNYPVVLLEDLNSYLGFTLQLVAGGLVDSHFSN